MANSSNKEFVINLIEFYKEALASSATSVKKLAELQKKYPTDYEIFKQTTLDPNTLPNLLAKLDDQSRGILVDIYFKQDMLSKKSAMLLQLNVKEKEEFAKQLEDFGNYIDEKIKKLI